MKIAPKFNFLQIGKGIAIILCALPVFPRFTAGPLYAQTIIPGTDQFTGDVNACPAGQTTPAPCSKNVTVPFSIPAGTTIGSIAILTTGFAGLDFKAEADDTSTTLCKAQHYSSATTCTVDVTFTPLAVGNRNGAIEFLDGSGDLLTTTYIYGLGIGPQVSFNPQPTKLIGTGFSGSAMAIDVNGNLFFSNTVDGTIVEAYAAGNYTSTRTIPLGSSYGDPLGIALDGAGNLFVTTEGATNGIYEVLAVGGYTKVKTILASDAGNSLALDGNGNIFYTTGDIDEILAAGGYTTIKTVFSGPGINDISIDPYGNLEAVEAIPGTNNGEIIQLFQIDDYSYPSYLGVFPDPSGIAGDSGSNIYFASNITGHTSTIHEFAQTDWNTYHTLKNPIQLTPGEATGISAMVLDSQGNLFVLGRNGKLGETIRSQPLAITFPATIVGLTDTSLPTTIANTGNADASGHFTLHSTDFKLVESGGSHSYCGTDGFYLYLGYECALFVEFTPQSVGPLTGSVEITSDTNNLIGAIQSMPLSGTGVASAIQVSPASLQFGSIPYPGSATKPLTITNITSSPLTIDPSSNGRGAIITGNNCGTSLAAGKSCTLQVEFKPVQFGPDGNTLTIDTNLGFGAKVPVRGTATGVGSLTTALTFGTVTNRGGSAIQFLIVDNFGVPGNPTVATATGATTFKVVENTCTAGVAAGGSCYIQVEYAPVQQGTQTGYLKLIPSTGPQQTIAMTGTLAVP